MRIFLTYTVLILTFILSFVYETGFAQQIKPAPDTQISTTTNILGIDDQRLKSGDLSMRDIPVILASLIQFGIAVAGTISIVMLIYFAIQMQLKSGITGDTTGVEQAKKWMFAAAVGFVIAISAWFIMWRVIDLLKVVSGN